MYDKLIFELSKSGRNGFNLSNDFVKQYPLDKKFVRDKSLQLPEVTELDVVRHYTNLSQKNYGVDSGFYPLGSCTMKYNPKINEELAGNSIFMNLHPMQPESTIQGALELYDRLQELLCQLTGMSAFTFNPFAGAHGELTGLMILKSYHLRRGDEKRNKIIVPTSAHGTNPASSSICGMETVAVQTNDKGLVDIDELKKLLNDQIAGIMLTNPNTLGLFEKDILEIANLIHNCGGLMYYDGANLNALLGKVKPRDMGFDIIHLNLHKTFSTPHGGGGPGSGPVGVRSDLINFLPNPQIRKRDGKYELYQNPEAIGRVSSFYGNFLVCLKAYLYILTLGREHISNVANLSVLNANYVKESLKDYYKLPITNKCMHEVVFDGLKNGKATTLQVAKRLLDYGYHPPTIYFPLLFHQSLMIEPTEVESKETLDAFIKAMIEIAKEAEEHYELLENAPFNTPIRRVDEVRAARKPILKYKDLKNE